jgi:hypothetical protein
MNAVEMEDGIGFDLGSGNGVIDNNCIGDL